MNPTHASYVRWITFVLGTFVRIVMMPIGQLPARSGCLHVLPDDGGSSSAMTKS